MGQRSQIYVRYNGNLIIANYYQWNYGERMISRARHGIEHLKYNLDNGYTFTFKEKTYIRKFSRIFDVNFDMRDVAISLDIVQEWLDYYPTEDFNDCVFNRQDNNDGQLFVDIRDDKIFYCFRDWEISGDGTVKNRIMDAKQYMDWDMDGWESNDLIPQDQKDACMNNIDAIREMATLMTEEQLNDFLTGRKPF